MTTGPLTGTRVVVLAGAGPSPYAAMALRNLGADVTRIDRPGQEAANPSGVGADQDTRTRGQRAVALDLRTPDGLAAARGLVAAADVFVEPYRPGVASRLGLGPDELCAAHPELIYVHATGWGQTGAWADRAGHDINYLGVTGVLHATGPADRPPLPPLNLLADYGAGGTHVVVGVLAALLERSRTGRGSVVDVAMVDAVASMTSLLHDMRRVGIWADEREANLFDGGAPCYRTYLTADGGFMAVGALEPVFYRRLLATLGLDEADWPQHDRPRWPHQRAELAAIFAGHDRAHWENVFGAVDCCVTPVLTPAEALTHPALASRGTLRREPDGGVVPAPAPRFAAAPEPAAAEEPGPPTC